MTRYQLEDHSSILSSEKNLSFCQHIRFSSGTNPLAYPMGTCGFPLQVKWPGHDANQAPEVKHVHNSTPTPPSMS